MNMTQATHAFVATTCNTCHEAGLSFYMGAASPALQGRPADHTAARWSRRTTAASATRRRTGTARRCRPGTCRIRPTRPAPSATRRLPPTTRDARGQYGAAHRHHQRLHHLPWRPGRRADLLQQLHAEVGRALAGAHPDGHHALRGVPQHHGLHLLQRHTHELGQAHRDVRLHRQHLRCLPQPSHAGAELLRGHQPADAAERSQLRQQGDRGLQQLPQPQQLGRGGAKRARRHRRTRPPAALVPTAPAAAPATVTPVLPGRQRLRSSCLRPTGSAAGPARQRRSERLSHTLAAATASAATTASWQRQRGRAHRQQRALRELPHHDRLAAGALRSSGRQRALHQLPQRRADRWQAVNHVPTNQDCVPATARSPGVRRSSATSGQGTCLSCHNGVIANGKPPRHVPRRSIAAAATTPRAGHRPMPAAPPSAWRPARAASTRSGQVSRRAGSLERSPRARAPALALLSCPGPRWRLRPAAPGQTQERAGAGHRHRTATVTPISRCSSPARCATSATRRSIRREHRDHAAPRTRLRRLPGRHHAGVPAGRRRCTAGDRARLESVVPGEVTLEFTWTRELDFVMAPTADGQGLRIRLLGTARNRRAATWLSRGAGGLCGQSGSSQQKFDPAAVQAAASALGAPAYVSETDIEDQHWYRLRVGPFTTRVEAERVLQAALDRTRGRGWRSTMRPPTSPRSSAPACHAAPAPADARAAG